MSDTDNKYYTTREAAQMLGISRRTLLRRIKTNKLEAEKMPGPYGMQYMLPAEQFDHVATATTDVVEFEKPVSAEEFRQTIRKEMRDAVREEIGALHRRIEDLEAQLQERDKQLEARDRKLLSEMREKQEDPQDGLSIWQKIRQLFT